MRPLRSDLCLHHRSHCRTSLRIPSSRPEHYHSPSLRSCRLQTIQLSVHPATARQMLLTFPTQTRSWLPLILQPVRPCCKEWLIEQLELRVVRSLARLSRCPCMVPSRVHLKLLECDPRRRRFDAGADPREPPHILIVRLLLPLRTQRVRHWMQITLWRSEWTPPGPSFSISRSVFSLPGILRLPKQPSIRVVCSLPVTKTLAPCQRQMICTLQSGKSSCSFVTAMPRLCGCSVWPNPLCALSSRPHPWLRSLQLPTLCLSLPCSWARPSAPQLNLTVHWTLAPAWFRLTPMYRCQSAQVTSHPPPSLQALLLLEASPSSQRLCTPLHEPWQSHLAAYPWTTNSSTPLFTRPVQISRPHQQIVNLSKQHERLNLKHWRFCQPPPPQQSPPLLLLSVRRQLLSPSRHRKARIVDTAAAEALCELSRTTPWNRPLRRTSKSTCRSPSEAFLDDRIPNGLSTSTEGHAPVPSFTALPHQGAARTLGGQVEHWRRLSKCIASFSLSLPQHEHRVPSNWALSLPVILRSHACPAAALHAMSLPYRWLSTPSCNEPLGLQCSSWSCRTSAQNPARCLVPPSAASTGMATRKERRQERQRSRPGSLNRRFTAPSEAEAEAGAEAAASSSTAPAAASTAPAADPSPSSTSSAPLAEPCRLTVKEVALLNYVQWQGRTGKPPPLTVYAEPSLQQVLRGLRQKKRQPLPPPEDEVEVVADLIHVPDDDRAPPHRDSAVKLKPKPKTKHGSTDAALPQSSPPSRSLQATATSSLDDLPCKIVAGDLTLASHDYKTNPVHARRRPKKRPKPRKDASKADSLEATLPLKPKEAAAQGSASDPTPYADGTTQASHATEHDRHPSSPLDTASTSLSPTAAANTKPLDAQPPGAQQPHATSPTTAGDTVILDHEHEERAKERVKKTKKADANPQLMSRHPRAAGTRTSRGTKLSRQATSTHSLKVASSSSRKRTATSMEIMDPDFRPDPATRPKIVSPWLDPMPKTAERYMMLRFLNLMHSRFRLPQPVLVDPHCPVLYASSTFPSPRLTPQRDCLRLSALIPDASLRSPASASSTLLEPCCHTEVRTSLEVSSPCGQQVRASPSLPRQAPTNCPLSTITPPAEETFSIRKRPLSVRPSACMVSFHR